MTSGPAAALQQSPMDPSQLRHHVGRQRSYSADDMCSSPARDGRWGTTHLHSAVLTGLEPGREHFYQIEGGPPVRFIAAQPTGPQQSFRFLVFVSFLRCV